MLQDWVLCTGTFMDSMLKEDAGPTLVLLSNEPLFYLSGHTNSSHQVSHVGP